MAGDVGSEAGRIGVTRRGHAPIRDRSKAKARKAQPSVQQIGKALGWFSVGLGLMEVAAPRVLARMIGLPEGSRQRFSRTTDEPSWLGENETDRTLRLFGSREIAVGVGLLSQRSISRWLWARVAGDVLDLAFLARRAGQAKQAPLVAAIATVTAVTALDVLSAHRAGSPRLASRNLESDGSLRLLETIAVNRTPEDCYGFWKDPRNLPRVFGHLASVEATGDRTTRWKADTPSGIELGWNARTTSDAPNELIVWESVEGSEVGCEGSVRFQKGPKGRGTLVRVAFRYRPPMGAMGAIFAETFGSEPQQEIRTDLRRFKSLIETGEVIMTDGQPTGPSRARAALARLHGASPESKGRSRTSA